ncbi:MAG: alkaline phosphatase family protein [Thermodesulfovibrionales bacterium]|nr:alkaline phosphatase family protein [Thermodesulfovibrionales bacterium]
MAKPIIIGIDGATPDLLFPWIEKGLLPNFERIKNEGAFGRLLSVPNQRSAAAWSSFITGTNPGRHGIFEFYERVPGSHEIRFTKSASRNGISLWKYLSDKGKTVISVNVPMSYPAENINGCVISGLDAPGKNSRGFTYPGGLLSEIEHEVGPYIQEPGVTSLVIAGRIGEALGKIIDSVRQRGKTVRYLMNKYEWDTIIAVFRETDPVQHCFWRYMNDTGSEFQDAILRVYQEVDREIGEIRSLAGEKCPILILSDHGFGFRQHGNGCLNQWLHEAGFLKMKRGNGNISLSKALKQSYQYMEKVLSRRIKEKLFGILPGLISKVHSKVFFASIDWENTIAYSDNVMPVIWINNIRNYQETVSEIKSALLERCREMNTGRQVIEWVKHRDEIYSGPYVPKAPDLLIKWKEAEQIEGLKYGAGGTPIRPRYPTREFTVISGDHRPMGIFMAVGEGIRSNHEVTGMDIMDVTALSIYLNHLPLPEFFDGRISQDIFDEEFLSLHPVGTEKYKGDTESAKTSDYSEEEEEDLRNRLRGLGYLE